MEILPPAKRRDMRSVSDVQHWKQVIGASWKAAASSILQVSKNIFDAKIALSQVDKELWKDLCNQLHNENIISSSIQKKLLVIGSKYDNLIAVADVLPPRYNAIYQLSNLSKSHLDKLAKSSKLSPSLEDREVMALLSPANSRNQSQPSSQISAVPLFRVVQTGKRIAPSAREALIASIDEIQNISGYELILTNEGKKLIAEDD
jgi:hypothetical protein